MRTAPHRLAFLSMLYVLEGLPFGFQATALGALLRERGVSLAHITLAGLLALPWSLKALWAPVVDRLPRSGPSRPRAAPATVPSLRGGALFAAVDRHSSRPFGRRKSWIVPMQALLALALLTAGQLSPSEHLVPLLVLVLVMNFVAATMDIAVDGLAVEILGERELGLGNAAQVVGYKVGMLLGGGVLLWLGSFLAWETLFSAAAALVLCVLAITVLVPEPSGGEAHAVARHEVSFAQIVSTLRAALRAPGAGALIVAIVGYKMGESLIEPLWSPFLIDHGLTRGEIGLYVGTYGMVASIAGSLTGGALASRVEIPRALLVASGLRLVALALQASIAWQTEPAHALVALSTSAEHFFSGVLTTVMFALMMSHTDRRIGATHYTLLATIEVIGKAPLSLASGAIAEALGVRGGFALGVSLSLAYLGVLASPWMRARLREPSPSP